MSSTTVIITKIERFCAYQERCESEVRRKLLSLNAQPDLMDDIVLALKNDNFINEERFVSAFVRGKINAKQWGKNKIKLSLFQKGIDASLINKYLDDVDESSYCDNLDVIVEKWERIHGQRTSDNYQKLVKFLLGKGYEYEVIKCHLKK